MSDAKLFLTAQRMAFECGVPESWLRAEAKAGRVPSLKVGRRLVFNPELVKRALLQRTESTMQSEVVHA